MLLKRLDCRIRALYPTCRGGHLVLLPQSSFLPSSDDRTLSSFRELLLHAYVIGSDEATSPCKLPHAPQQGWVCGPSLACSLVLTISVHSGQETQAGLIRVLHEMKRAAGVSGSPLPSSPILSWQG